MERTNQMLENALPSVEAWYPSAKSTFPSWVEYAQNSVVSSSSGISPFIEAMGYQPPRSTTKRVRLRFHQSGLIYTVASESGGRYVPPFCTYLSPLSLRLILC